jgi:hypothetical protein
MITFKMLLPVLIPLLILLALVLVLNIIKLIWMYIKFQKSSYSQVSGNKFFTTILDTGKYGEYLTFRLLERLPGEHRILTNLYIPKPDGTTTEIDLLMVDSTGISVFESKNFSGWIFGTEKDKNWTQSLNGRVKKKFLNPIIQNRGHVNALAKVFPEVDRCLLYSYIVFSERCELKKVTITSPEAIIVKRNELKKILRKDQNSRQQILSKERVDELFEKLSQFANADEIVKNKHVERIKSKS